MRKSSFYNIMIVFACIFCNISQIPVLFDNRGISLAYMGIWLILAVFMLIRERTIRLRYFLLPIAFDMFCIILWLFKGGYVSSDLFRPINLCSFVLLIGIWAGSSLNESNLKMISGSFISSSLIVALYLYFNIFRGVNWAGTGGYLYGSKNSAGQIFLTAIILLVLFYGREHKFLTAGLCVFLSSLIIMMKSRATLLTLVLIIFYILIFVVENTYYKVIGLTAIISVIILVLTNDSLYDIYINQILLNNRSINDFSAITSNRDIQYEYFMQHFGEHWLIGTGGTYIEAMPLSVLMSFGIIGGIPVLLFSLYPLYIGLKNRKIKAYRLFCNIIITLGLVMWINGIFEQQSPFGPGVKCYFLWLVTGLFLGYKQRKEKYEREY